MSQPLPGPLDTAPEVTHEVALAMLGDILDDLPMGPWDVEVRSWVELADPAAVAAVASWLRGAWHAGVEAGRGELVEEARDATL